MSKQSKKRNRTKQPMKYSRRNKYLCKHGGSEISEGAAKIIAEMNNELNQIIRDKLPTLIEVYSNSGNNKDVPSIMPYYSDIIALFNKSSDLSYFKQSNYIITTEEFISEKTLAVDDKKFKWLFSLKMGDNSLLYPYYVGKTFINKYIDIYPCFCSTHKLFIQNVKENDIATALNDYKRNIKDNTIGKKLFEKMNPYPIFLKYSIDTGNTDAEANTILKYNTYNDKDHIFFLLTDYKQNCYSLDYVYRKLANINNNNKLRFIDIIYIFFQIFFVLNDLSDKAKFKINDITQIYLVKQYPNDNRKLQLNYHVSQSEIVSFTTKYITVFRNYENVFIEDKVQENNTSLFNTNYNNSITLTNEHTIHKVFLDLMNKLDLSKIFMNGDIYNINPTYIYFDNVPYFSSDSANTPTMNEFNKINSFDGIYNYIKNVIIGIDYKTIRSNTEYIVGEMNVYSQQQKKTLTKFNVHYNGLASDYILRDYNITEYVKLYTHNQKDKLPKGLQNLNIGDWNVSHIYNMRHLFADSGFNEDISKWDVSNVVDMRTMFRNCYKFNQDISNWNVSNVRYFSNMFLGADLFDLKQIDKWNNPFKILASVKIPKRIIFDFDKINKSNTPSQ